MEREAQLAGAGTPFKAGPSASSDGDKGRAPMPKSSKGKIKPRAKKAGKKAR